MLLKTRFFLLFTLITVTFAAIGIYAHFSLKKIKHLTSIDNTAQENYIKYLELNKYQNNYTHWDLIQPAYFDMGISENIKYFNKSYGEIQMSFGQLVQDPLISKIGVKNKFSDAQNYLKEYKDAFDKYVAAKYDFGFKDWGVVGNMRAKIHAVETELSGIKHAYFSVHMLMLRRHEKDYLLRRDLKYKEKFDKEWISFDTAVRRSRISAAQKEELLMLLHEYQLAFHALLDMDKKIGISFNDGLSGELNQASQKNLDTLSVLKETIAYKIQNYIDWVYTYLIAFIAICALASIATGLFIIQGIRRLMGGEPEEVATIAENVANGNLKMELLSSDHYSGIKHSVVVMTEKLKEIISSIYKNADNMLVASQEFSKSANHISQDTYTQASSIDEISATMEEISQNISRNAESSIESENLAKTAREKIMDIKKQTDFSLKTSQTISEKINIINSIAHQTTILALNAAVEAARAGENGAGFRVIAEEVKRLANVSKEAAEEIHVITKNNLTETEKVDLLVAEILEPIRKTSDLVNNISLVSQEQESGTRMVVESINELYSISQKNAAASQEMAANSEELEAQSHSLIDMVGYFKMDKNSVAAVTSNKKIRKKFKRWANAN